MRTGTGPEVRKVKHGQKNFRRCAGPSVSSITCVRVLVPVPARVLVPVPARVLVPAFEAFTALAALQR